MKMFAWGKDVNDTGYKIFTIFFSKKLGFDIYLFHYPKGSYIPKHKDPKKNGDMYRFNIEIVKAKKGGKFCCNNKIFSFFDRIFFFNASRSYHHVTPIEEGSRWVLSFGKTIK